MTKTIDPHGSDRDRKPAPLAVPASSSVTPTKPMILVDYEKYAHFLEEADLSEDQKREFLQSLWGIITQFVSLGFGVHPLQQAHKPSDNNENSVPLIGRDVLLSSHSNNPLKSQRRNDSTLVGVGEREES